MRKLLGFFVALACYVPIVFLALWLGKEKTATGIIAAGLFLFFGFIVCLAIYGAVGIPDKDKPVHKPVTPKPEKRKRKSRDKLDPETSALSVIMADTDSFDDYD